MHCLRIFSWTQFDCLNDAEALRGDNLLLHIKSSEIPGTHFTDLRRKKGL